MTILVTGANGFVGSYVAEWPGAVALGGEGVVVDVRDPVSLANAVALAKPDAVVHLAAQSYVPSSFQNPKDTFDVNFYGTLNLLAALEEIDFKGRLLYVGSGDEYGKVSIEDMPIRESLPLRPRNPYAVSKVAAEVLCYQWSQSGPFEIVMVRPFNHFGPRQDSQFVIADFARQIVRIRLDKMPAVIEVGNIDVTRDFSDVRDVVRAYHVVLERGHNGEAYNVCSGQERSVRSILELLLHLAGVTATVVHRKDRVRPNEQLRVWGSFEKLKKHTGWSPQIPIEKTLRDTLEYWDAREK